MQDSKGLTSIEAKQKQAEFGKNELAAEKKRNFFKMLLGVLGEPMFLLLLIAATIYFILGEPVDGAVMLIFVLGIIGIEIFQEWKTDKTLNALKELSAPRIRVLRDGIETEIASGDIVPGDIMMICEGVKIPADGFVIRCNDLCVDESSLTGESEGVWKALLGDGEDISDYWRKDYCYAGTFVTQGTAVMLVDKIGVSTEYGKIGMAVSKAVKTKTPLQKQIGGIVRISAVIALVLFIGVGIITWLNIPTLPALDRLITSILAGITLAMAMIPEEFPVILAVFMSMGAWRLAKKNSLVRKLPSVETLGAVSVLCVDKTGTITMNQMAVQEVWAASGDEAALGETMGLACETDAYDPMEKAMLAYCESLAITKAHLFGGKLMGEYAFTNENKMMGHVWRHDGEIIIAAKGSPERILTICELSDQERNTVENKIRQMSGQGLRVIAVAVAKPENESQIPQSILDCRLTFCGLAGLSDPPRGSVKEDIAACRKAGIRVVMITGDNGITAAAIAKKVGIQHCGQIITGDMLENMTDGELRESVKTAGVFSRVTPQHKLRIVKAFQDNGEIVAMTGDGVNDAPALKRADIGIAMGKRGSEVSREAADLILLDDNFSTIVDTVKDGRRIYDNIRKAIGYVLAVHIPIALAALLAPALGITADALLFLPMLVVLLELVIDPTCSIVLERQPAETDIMSRAPRDPKKKMLDARILCKSVLQGLFIFAASFGAYYYMLSVTGDAGAGRSMGIGIIMTANLFLVLVNSSDRNGIFKTAKRLRKDKVLWIVNGLVLLGLVLLIYSPFNTVFKLAPLSAVQFFIMLGAGAFSVLWYEMIKLIRRLRRKKIAAERVEL